jgi:hypothetical protein
VAQPDQITLSTLFITAATLLLQNPLMVGALKFLHDALQDLHSKLAEHYCLQDFNRRCRKTSPL